MSYSGGVYTPPSNSWNPAVAGSAINATDWAALLADLTTALSTCVLKDGTQTITGNLPMGGFKLTGLPAGTTNGDSVRFEQITGTFLAITGGTLTGDLLFTDAIFDIGKSGATRPRDGFFSRNLTVGGHATLEGVTATGATGTGKLVFNGTPTLVTPLLGTPTSGNLVNCSGYPVSTNGTPTATTSGTSVLMTGIPAGTKRITLSLNGVSTNGTSILLVQIGPSGGVENSGYVSRTQSTGGNTGSTAGFILDQNHAAADLVNGQLILSLENSANNTWTAMGIFNLSNTAVLNWAAGIKSTAGVVDRIAITTVNGSDTFDAGEINIQFHA